MKKEDSIDIDEKLDFLFAEVLMKEKYSETCLNPLELFRCTQYRDKYATKLKKIDGPITRKATVCCEGYKQIGDRCVYDKDYHNSDVLSFVFIVASGQENALKLTAIFLFQCA